MAASCRNLRRAYHLLSSIRLSFSTFTRGSPRIPNWRPEVARSTSRVTASTDIPRARATRAIWYLAAAGEMSGSTPEADAVTRSTGTGAVLPGSAACSVSMRCLIASIRDGLVGPRFDAPDDDGLYGDRKSTR